ncbi:hypothetical protein [Micromonospora purpureochromogenes]|uniref:hypothetical protein n=1 Tax=Micromonospora purpureochromogenes TaxID=47872 RepID=UPI000B5AF251|nr:hypothetical protein [Micromonospora purpureochromogenes]
MGRARSRVDPAFPIRPDRAGRLELHGTMHQVACTGCGARTPSEQTLARVAAGDGDPGPVASLRSAA